ncbi:hypothetical protein D9V74_00370 [Buchnera aphidicola (Macrosiphoniella sanborni)]|uniref:Uncharacterized protein n=1 Tax=Buchnera aphidicola (Macrosiphoniella sanborni) TaxID=1241865 RepID=A0A4D6YH28_9GAMM|nr:hypothetical protein [Buchnera aphidicola]QCI23645.1 hypothetical protein D9V74_00370 [Buchnera aphidicola (Macrosiphoniella sanborni)]
MLETVNKIIYEEIIINKDNNFLYPLHNNVLNKYFNESSDDISLQKKKYDDKNIIYSHFYFLLDNLLNIFSKKDVTLTIQNINFVKDKNIKKKK